MMVMGVLNAGCSNMKFDGLSVGMSDLPRLSDAQTRSISPENFTGEKGQGGATPLERGSAAHAAQDLGTCCL